MILVNKRIIKNFCDHLFEMGIKHSSASIVNVIALISIKVVHILYGDISETKKLQESTSLINVLLGNNQGISGIQT